MKMTDQDRMTLKDGLDWLIREQEAKIQHIQGKTDVDYPAAKALEEFMEGGFSLEREKERESMKAQAEIKRLNGLSNMLNDGRNQFLVVPDTIQLHLTAEAK